MIGAAYANGEGARANVTGEEEGAEEIPCALLPPLVARQLLGLALSLPASEPRVMQCLSVLSDAVRDTPETSTAEQERLWMALHEKGVAYTVVDKGVHEGTTGVAADMDGPSSTLQTNTAGACAAVPLSVLEVLSSYRVLGPHLRCSSRWGAMQRCVDAQMQLARAQQLKMNKGQQQHQRRQH